MQRGINKARESLDRAGSAFWEVTHTDGTKEVRFPITRETIEVLEVTKQRQLDRYISGNPDVQSAAAEVFSKIEEERQKDTTQARLTTIWGDWE